MKDCCIYNVFFFFLISSLPRLFKRNNVSPKLDCLLSFGESSSRFQKYIFLSIYMCIYIFIYKFLHLYLTCVMELDWRRKHFTLSERICSHLYTYATTCTQKRKFVYTNFVRHSARCALQDDYEYKLFRSIWDAVKGPSWCYFLT